MTPMRWTPLPELMGLQDRVNQIFSGTRRGWDFEDAITAWSPSVDILEKGDDLVIRAELPGVERDDIEISIEDSTLELRGERKQEAESDNDRVHRRERFHGTFSRRFKLPATVDSGRIEARYRNGVLEVVLPKLEAAKPRKVEIQAA